MSITLATTNARPPHRPFGIETRDRLFHMLALGQTGSGKSSLLLYMAKQDVDAGQGFCLIDPHGDLAGAVADYAGDHALVWNVGDPACELGYNPLTHVSDYVRPLVASGIIETLKKQWADAWGARMEHLLRYSLLALLERKGSSFQDIMPMFLNKDFRESVIAGVADTQVRQFWEVEYPAMNYKGAVDGVAPIANKAGALLAHPLVRRALCDPAKPLRFRQLMDEGKVLVVNLAKGKIGADTANVLGGLIVSSIANAAYSRQNVPETDRKPWFLYVDEFSSFTTDAFADMLSELRKYGVGICATVQHRSRVSGSVWDSLMGNVSTLIAFRVGADDADALARQFGGDIQARDLVGLANYEMFIKLMVGGAQTKAFSARTLPPESLLRHAA